jgi:NADH:ubiquinone oxidoreductase subunit H
MIRPHLGWVRADMSSEPHRRAVDGALYAFLTILTFLLSLIYYGWITTTAFAVGMMILLVNILPVVRASPTRNRPDRANDVRWLVLMMIALLVVVPQLVTPGE